MAGMGAKRYILALFVVCLCGCALHGKHVMEQAEVLLHDGQAEKAYVLLHEVLPHYRQLPAEEKARFGLLYFIALDKTFKSLQPEELIRFSAEYYRRHGQYALLSRSLLYYSRTCQQQQREEEAVTSMAEACHYAPTDDHDLLGKLYDGMGDVYNKRGKYDLAREQYDIALQHFKQTGNANNQAAVICSMGYTFFLSDQDDSATVYYHRALRLATDSLRIASILGRLAENYHDMGQYDSAGHYIRASFQYPIWPAGYPFHVITLADIFFDTEQYDSAYHYASQLVVDYPNNALVQKNAYRLLTNIVYTKKEWDKVPVYLDMYQQYDQQVDSIAQSIPQPSTLQDLQEATDEARRGREGIMVAAFLLFAVLVASVAGWYWQHKRHQAKLHEVETHEESKREQVVARLDMVAERQLKRSHLLHHLELNRQKLEQRHKGRPIPPEELRKLYTAQLFLDKPGEYARLMCSLFGPLTKKLMPYKLRSGRLLYIYLLLLDVSKSDICAVLDCKPGSVERTRNRLALKFGLGSARKLDTFLQSLAHEALQEFAEHDDRS